MRAPRCPRGLVWGLLAWLAASSLASANPQGEDDTQAARELFQRGAEHYRFGRYSSALALFQSSLAVAKRPNTIFNIAQCHRLIGETERALQSYRLYLSEAGKSGQLIPHRLEVMGHISKLEADLAALDEPELSTVRPIDPPVHHAATSGPTTAAAQPPKVVLTGASAPTRAPQTSMTTPFYKTWWFWTAAAAVVVGSIAVTVAATSGGDDRVAQSPDGRFTPATF